MGIQRWTEELLRGLSDPTFGVTLQDLDHICVGNAWGQPTDPRAKAAMTKLGAPWQVAAVAFHTRERFHALHPEFGRLARWLERSVNRIAAALDPVRACAQAMAEAHASPSLVLGVDDVLQGRSIQVTCGPQWPSPTVTWRDVAVRQTKFGPGLSFVRAGNRPPAKLSANLLVENVTQSAARNALCTGLLELDRRGFPYILHVHDEVLLVVPRTRAEVLRAKAELLAVFGPGGYVAQRGWDWSVIIKPGDVTMSRTLWESEEWAARAWPRLESGDETVFGELP